MGKVLRHSSLLKVDDTGHKRSLSHHSRVNRATLRGSLPPLLRLLLVLVVGTSPGRPPIDPSLAACASLEAEHTRQGEDQCDERDAPVLSLKHMFHQCRQFSRSDKTSLLPLGLGLSGRVPGGAEVVCPLEPIYPNLVESRSGRELSDRHQTDDTKLPGRCLSNIRPTERGREEAQAVSGSPAQPLPSRVLPAARGAGRRSVTQNPDPRFLQSGFSPSRRGAPPAPALAMVHAAGSRNRPDRSSCLGGGLKGSTASSVSKSREISAPR